MNIKLVVKAMNFHALLHVESARRKAKNTPIWNRK